jgi:hypothetical protein
MSTILKSFAVCVVLLGAWHVLVNRLPTKYRVGGNAGSQHEQNVMRGETFVYATSQPRVVIVGSSIANRLKDLPRDWFNLSFNGGSAFTGLEMISRAGKVPQVVLIETNMLLLPADEKQLSELFAPGIYHARRRLAFLVETNKPHLVAQRALISGEERTATREQPKSGASSPAANGDTELEPDAAGSVLSREQFDLLEARRAGELAEPLDSSTLQRIIGDLRRHVAVLEKRGVRVVFFEMPEYADFREMPRPTSVRQRLLHAFPDSRYSWVTEVDCATYRTTDFVHLTAAGSKRYAEVLKAHVASLCPAEEPTVPATVATPTAPSSSARTE